MKRRETTFKRELSYLNKKRSYNKEEDAKENLSKIKKSEEKKTKESSSFSTDSLSESGKNISIPLKEYSQTNKNKKKKTNLDIIYIIDKGKFFKKENKESNDNNIEYSCFIEKNNDEIYFYQYVKYNIDDIEDNNYCYRCNDLNCNGLISIKYKEKEIDYEIINDHSLKNKKHSYIMYPTYGYQIYLDFIKEYNDIK